ncbi:glycogen debranching enzyme family protein [Candidatus Bathyarchaeota archaeon]|nr:glycogen debranching enzyme family protein [Candidatus Bathyarchaeota archaeon]
MKKFIPSIRLNEKALSNVGDSLQKEWIITNGLGGYASSTVLGINTRKYHGVLVAAFKSPRNRRVCVAKLDEELKVGNAFYPAFANEFQSGIFPRGHEFLQEFHLSPFPRYVYSIQNVRFSKTLFMPYKRNATITAYEFFNANAVNVTVRIFPLITCRHFHSIVDRWHNPPKFSQKTFGRRVKINVEKPQATIVLEATHGAYTQAERWIERIYFREEQNRGESHLDDWYQPGFFEIKVRGKSAEKFGLNAVAGEDEPIVEEVADEMPVTMYDIENLYNAECERREQLLERFYEEHKGIETQDWLSWLVYATDMFIVGSFEKAWRSVVAGYHWFEDWGRDTFISLPGLMLVTGRFEDARQTFLAFNQHFMNGLIPNFISDADAKPVYNAVDATLWYVNAVLQYLKYTGDFEFVERNLWKNMKTVVENFEKGKSPKIRIDNDGLILHGPQLTWMDTAINGQPVTPRAGKAVEVQALWHNALKTLEILARKFKEVDTAEKFAQLAEKARESFNAKFWNSEKGCLFDAVDEHGIGDPSIRPNQIIAVALDFKMLDETKSSKVVDVVRRELLTPFGLRTLARGDPRYVGFYRGDRRSRDLAYHNGAVWPWLLGPFVRAYLRVEGYGEYTREYAFRSFLAPLLTTQVFAAGFGAISEVFDGDPPHKAGGCIAQAWSVAEPLRAYVEDILYFRPPFEREIFKI